MDGNFLKRLVNFDNSIWFLSRESLENKLEATVSGSRKYVVKQWSIPEPSPAGVTKILIKDKFLVILKHFAYLSITAKNR